MAFNNWPYTNFQDLNLGWILGKLGVVERLATDSAASVAQYDARITANTNAIGQLGIELDAISDVARVFVNSNLEAYYRGKHITGSELFSVFQSHGTLPFVEYNGEVYMLDSVSNAGDMRFSMGHTVDQFNELVIRHIMIPAQSYNAAYSITNVSAGGGGSSGNVFAVKITDRGAYADPQYICDHTYAEIYSQMESGRIPILLVSFGSNPVSYQICGMGRNATKTVSGQTIQEICFADPSWMTDSGNNNVGEWFIDANNYIGHVASLKQLATLDNIIQFVNDGVTTNALLKTAQTLSAAEKAQVKQNIGISEGFPYINVKNFGAMGNGVTDDTQAFAQAISSMNDGDVLYIPVGVYIVTDIALKSHMTVLGEGEKSEIRLAEGLSGSINGNCLSINGTENSRIQDVSVKNIKLNGMRATQTSTGTAADQRLNGIHIRYADNITIEDVITTNNGYHGLIATYTTKLRIFGCRSYDNGFRSFHAHDGCADIIINNNYAYNNGLGVSGGSGNLYDGLLVFGVTRCTLSNNIIKANLSSCISVGNDSDNITISGNSLECYNKTASYGVNIGSVGVYLSAGCINVTVSGNSIKHCAYGVLVYGSSTTGDVMDCCVTGNSFLDCDNGIETRGFSNGNSFVGNVFYNCIAKALNASRDDSIAFCNNMIITDDTITGEVTATCINLYDVNDSVVSGNKIKCNSHFRNGIRIYGNTTGRGINNVVDNNKISGATVNAISIEITDNIKYSNVVNNTLET